MRPSTAMRLRVASRPRWGCTLAALFAFVAARADEPAALLTAPLAEAFGSAPLVSGVRMSPDGSRLSFLQTQTDGQQLVRVFDTDSGDIVTVLAGERDSYDIRWCGWANGERLLCSLRYIEPFANTMSARSRLASVAVDGSRAQVLMQGRYAPAFAQYQDNIIDWLPDDPDHVLLGIRGQRSQTVLLDVVSGEFSPVGYEQDGALDWITDGHGQPRLRVIVNWTHRKWQLREPDGSWSTLHEARLDDLDDEFAPLAFNPATNEVLHFDLFEGRRALFAMSLEGERRSRLVYGHPRVDVAGTFRLGKYHRVVAAEYVEDRPMLSFFDPTVERVHGQLAAEFPGMNVNVIDEDWARRKYLVFVNSDRDPGTYYVFDTEDQVLSRFARAYPALGERELAAMRPITYSARDGTRIPAYLTAPPDSASGAAVVLPHGGPSARDYWQFDFLTQYLVARGYTVLQSNYRGSAGYGADWAGDGGFRGWRRAVDDIADGARYLVDAGLAERGRICIVGWSYGGYAALQSAIEYPRLYRCVVSIAGVTDPIGLARNAGYFVGSRETVAFIGVEDEEVRDAGSPVRRVEELLAPTLLFHARKDINVPFDQSAALLAAANDVLGDVQLIEYEHAEHDIRPARYRIDLLARLGNFLETHSDGSQIDFFSRPRHRGAPVDLVDYGEDQERPDGRCADTRFQAIDGGSLTDRTHRIRFPRHDATDCRELYRRGEIVLADTFVADAAAGVDADDRVTLFLDPSLQDAGGILSLDGRELRRGSDGAPVVRARPGYRVVAVRSVQQDYRCFVVPAAGSSGAEATAAYLTAAGNGRAAEPSVARIPAYAGHYYRIESEVVEGTLALIVTDETEGRVAVDQRPHAAAGCPGD